MSTLAAKLSSPKLQRRVFWVAAAILAAGVIAFVVTRFTNTASSTQAPLHPNVPVQDVSKTPKTVKLDPAAKRVAQEFILTAVARKNLDKAYGIVGPAIKQGQSLKSWMTGNIAVVPFPVTKLDIAPMKIDYSYPNEAGIEVALLPKKGQGALFAMTLIKRNGKWLVNGWVPASKPPVPCGGGGNC